MILQDFTGVPAVVDLAAMREAVVKLGGKADSINPLSPAELVIDHSVQVDHYGTPTALAQNIGIEFERNMERYSFLRWGQKAFHNFNVVPPNTGIVHQVNIEHLARVVFGVEANGRRMAYPDTLVGTDSHTTMVNALGVLGWGVGGIEAEAAMLGQPVTMLIPQVLGVRLTGSLREGTTATDLVLTLTELLRKKGVVNKFVEFFGDGLSNLPLAESRDDRQHGAGVRQHLRDLPHRPRDHPLPRADRARARARSRWSRPTRRPRACGGTTARHNPCTATCWNSTWRSVEPTLAGPRRPTGPRAAQGRDCRLIASRWPRPWRAAAGDRQSHGQPWRPDVRARRRRRAHRRDHQLHQHVESLRDGRRGPAGAERAPQGPDGQALGKDQPRPRLPRRDQLPGEIGPAARISAPLGFNVVGYGCTTCIGNSGPLDEAIGAAVREHKIDRLRGACPAIATSKAAFIPSCA